MSKNRTPQNRVYISRNTKKRLRMVAEHQRAKNPGAKPPLTEILTLGILSKRVYDERGYSLFDHVTVLEPSICRPFPFLRHAIDLPPDIFDEIDAEGVWQIFDDFEALSRTYCELYERQERLQRQEGIRLSTLFSSDPEGRFIELRLGESVDFKEAEEMRDNEGSIVVPYSIA